MTEIAKFDVNGHDVIVKMLSPEEVSNSSFHGQKILHPMKIKKVERVVTMKGKRNRTFEKRITDAFYSSDFVSKEAQSAIEDPQVVGIKFDGSCGAVHYDPETNTHTMYTRIDLKFSVDNKISMCGKQYDSASDLPSAMIPCESDPRDGQKYEDYGKLHWPFMIPIATSTAGAPMEILQLVEGINVTTMYKWNLVAFENAVASGKLSRFHKNITCEQMGKQLNLKEACDLMPKLALVPHNSMVLDVPPELCTFSGICELLQKIPTIEGLVICGKDGTIWKFRRDMVQIGEEKLSWPPKSVQPTDWALRTALL